MGSMGGANAAKCAVTAALSTSTYTAGTTLAMAASWAVATLAVCTYASVKVGTAVRKSLKNTKITADEFAIEMT